MKLEGALEFATVGAQLDTPFEGSCDLSGVTKMDSAGLSLLLELKRRAKTRGAVLGFINVPPSVKRLADHFGVSAILGLES